MYSLQKSRVLPEFRDENERKHSHNRKCRSYDYDNGNCVISATERLDIFALNLTADKTFTAPDTLLILGRLKDGIIISELMLGNRSHVATYVAALVTIVVVFVTVDHPIITANIADSIAGVIIFMPLGVSFKSALITFAVTLSVIYVIAHRASLAAFVTFAVAAAVKAMRHSHVKLRAAKVTRLVTIGGRTMRNMLASFSTVSTGSIAWAFIFVVGAISHR